MSQFTVVWARTVSTGIFPPNNFFLGFTYSLAHSQKSASLTFSMNSAGSSLKSKSASDENGVFSKVYSVAWRPTAMYLSVSVREWKSGPEGEKRWLTDSRKGFYVIQNWSHSLKAVIAGLALFIPFSLLDVFLLSLRNECEAQYGAN